ncbi:hydrogenase nickel incorporation protein HypB [Lachnoclostridium sp. Marseille-P6806]|uniref:hydrogenase nickel incorporation protein HypB n=1 Tax=Lachnoclostridium sp. Marseille-P6806 TaxID=2364793 RepID=UPI00103094C0|nr:hydrogenase nickel incorporation protein HypB [Lachnoclostridium sp. Marseille-P6806]
MSDKAFEILETKTRLLADNDREAEAVRALLAGEGVFLVNLMASPGAGKTTTLVRTIEALKDRYRIGVMEADVDSDIDAKAIAATGARVIQLHTGGSCHMDADMTRRGLEGMGIRDLDLVFLENVGNLVCPAEFDVGAQKKVMILSVPEGDDKSLKYPLMFRVSDCMLVNKIDTAPVFDFDMEACRERVLALNPDMKIIPLSSGTGENFEEWLDWLEAELQAFRAKKG